MEAGAQGSIAVKEEPMDRTSPLQESFLFYDVNQPPAKSIKSEGIYSIAIPKEIIKPQNVNNPEPCVSSYLVIPLVRVEESEEEAVLKYLRAAQNGLKEPSLPPIKTISVSKEDYFPSEEYQLRMEYLRAIGRKLSRVETSSSINVKKKEDLFPENSKTSGFIVVKKDALLSETVNVSSFINDRKESLLAEMKQKRRALVDELQKTININEEANPKTTELQWDPENNRIILKREKPFDEGQSKSALQGTSETPSTSTGPTDPVESLNPIPSRKKLKKSFQVCEKMFAQLESLTNITRDLVECVYCGDKFTEMECLKVHLAEHRGEQVYRCDICQMTFSWKSKLYKHKMVVHTNEKSFCCKICEKTFALPDSLIMHMKTHTGEPPVREKPVQEKPYRCTVCGKSFVRPSRLSVHMEVHAEKRYRCVCGKAFLRPFQLEKHMKIHTETRYRCEICEIVFLRLDQLRTHEKSHMKRQYKCSVCNKVYTKRDYFEAHVKTHIGEKEVQCKGCDKTFKNVTMFKKHLNIPPGYEPSRKAPIRLQCMKSPYQCNICEKTFKDGGYLKAHAKLHTEGKPFRCKICERVFVQLEKLKTHMLLHYGEEAFQCKICEKNFLDDRSLKGHIRCHNEKKLIMQHCELCGDSFATLNLLEKHTRRQHKYKYVVKKKRITETEKNEKNVEET